MQLRLVTCALLVSAAMLMSCAGKPVKGLLQHDVGDNARFTSSDGRVAISLLPYSSDMERNVFGVDLGKKKQMAVEVAVKNLLATDGRTFVFHRHNAMAVFGDGTRRYPIDPMKVYQKNRVDKATAGFLLGITGHAIAAAADSNRRIGLAEASERELRLTPEQPTASGFLYFDTEGIQGREIAEIIVDYEEVGVDELWRATIDLAGFEFRPPPIAPEDRLDAHYRSRGIE